jgi:nitrite reductase (NO-forming)
MTTSYPPTPPPDRSHDDSRGALTPGRGIALLVAAVSLSIVAAMIATPSAVPMVEADTETATEAPAATSTAAEPDALPDEVADIVRAATDLPEPVGDREPTTLEVELTTVELEGWMEDGTAFTYWTFDETVPGPMIRGRVGDTVELTLTNHPDSTQPHSIDLHAVTGPGGGAGGTQVAPGESKTITFELLNPGIYVYHCATPHIPTHVALGMYGLIIVEPEGGYDEVDHEFYIMQGEFYTQQNKGTEGHVHFDGGAMLDENPTYVVFNGAANALTGERQMEAEVGDTIRFFVGNGGPNLSSSFHVIGEIFDRVHPEGAEEVLSSVQTTAVLPGGATMTEMELQVPGDLVLVDHALSRALDKGAVGIVHVTGDAVPGVYDAPDADGDDSGH